MTKQDDKFNQALIEKIKDEKISPKPKWHFLLKNYAIWVLGVTSLVLGSIAVSLIIYMLRYNDWDLYLRAGKNPAERLLMIIPFFWLLCLAIFLVLVYFEIKKTRTGYRYPTGYVILISLAVNIVLGGAFYGLGLGEKIDDILGRRAPFYERFINPHVRFWSSPKEGRLAGLVISQVNNEELVLVDIERQEWNLAINELEVDSKFFPEVGKPARFVGQQTGERAFSAKKFFPVSPGREFFSRFALKPLLPAPGMMPGPNDGQGPRGHKEMSCSNSLEWDNLFSQYPQLKEAFAEDLLANKEALRGDQRTIDFLKVLYSDSDLIQKLQE